MMSNRYDAVICGDCFTEIAALKGANQGGPRGAPRIDGEQANACAKGELQMSTSNHDQSVFRIDRFVVPAAAEAEFLAAVTETNTVFEAMEECLQLGVVKEEEQ